MPVKLQEVDQCTVQFLTATVRDSASAIHSVLKGKFSSISALSLGKITTRVLCRQSPLNLHQFHLTRDSKYGLVVFDWNGI